MLQTAQAAGPRKRHRLATGCYWLWENEKTASLHLLAWWWRKEKPLPSDRRRKTKIHFSNSSHGWWLISHSLSLMPINQIINNFFRDSGSATILSTHRASGKRCIGDQTSGTRHGWKGIVRASQPFVSFFQNEQVQGKRSSLIFHHYCWPPCCTEDQPSSQPHAQEKTSLHWDISQTWNCMDFPTMYTNQNKP